MSNPAFNFQDRKVATFRSLQGCTQSFAQQEQWIFKWEDERDREAVIHTLSAVLCFLAQTRIWDISKEEAGLWGISEENPNTIQIIF